MYSTKDAHTDYRISAYLHANMRLRQQGSYLGLFALEFHLAKSAKRVMWTWQWRKLGRRTIDIDVYNYNKYRDEGGEKFGLLRSVYRYERQLDLVNDCIEGNLNT